MSEEPLVNKSQPQSALTDADYDLIHGTVSETAQGRRFLEEYARRCRPSEPDASLAAIERMQAAIRQGSAGERVDLLLEMAEMAQMIARMRAEILAIKPPGSGPFDAMEELNSIVQTTETATSHILTAAEQVQEIAWTMRESGSVEALCDELDARATEIYTACSFQDLTGQRTQKVIQLLRYLEDRINTVVSGRDKTFTALKTAGEPSFTSSSPAQAGVDAVMQPRQNERQDDRQDATLEDIGRQMLAIEPMIGSQQAVSEQPDIAFIQSGEDVRPQLSVSERVLREADAARRLAERPVEPAEAELASMILRRLEAELSNVPAAAAPEQAVPLQQTAAEEPDPPAVTKGEAGAFNEPALMTPETLPPQAEAEAEQPKFDAPHDPLAPLRAMSEAQKIALFS